MLKFTFVVDKEACFAYWAQGLIHWSHYFEKQEFRFYRKKGEPWTDKEERALAELNGILIRKDKGFLWLWQRYSGEKLSNISEIKKWNDIKAALENQFTKVWQNEERLLDLWSSELQRCISKFTFSDFLSRLGHFFGISKLKSENIEIKLLPYSDLNFPAGHVKKEFPNLILLNISNLKREYANRALEVLLHEITHLFEYQSPFSSELLKKSYKKIIAPRLPITRRMLQNIFAAFGVLKIKTPSDPSWRSLMVEAVLGSIANRRHYSYAGINLFGRFSENDRISRTEGTIDYLKNYNNYGLQIREVAELLVPLTKDYLDSRKRINTEYCDYVAHNWLKIWNQYHKKNEPV